MAENRPVSVRFNVSSKLPHMTPTPSNITLYDTTLRDGAQGEGIHFSLADKLRIAQRLDAFGMHYIEGGWPGSNEKDIEFFREAKKLKFKQAKIAAFGSTRRANTPVEKDPQVNLLLEAGTPVVTLVCKTSPLHVTEILRTTLEENLAMIRDTIAYLVANGREVIFDGEHTFDGYKENPNYSLACYQAADEAGASYLVACDTNGGTMPTEVADITRALLAKSKRARLGIHTHDDCGLGVANALAAIEAGALQVQGTVNGYGERTGNCNLITSIANLQLKMNRRILSDEKVAELCDLSFFVDEVANQRPSGRAPFVGSAAFAHKGGIHVNAVNKLARSYEHIEPEKVGNRQRVLVGELAGRANIMLKARTLGLKLGEKSPEALAVLEKVKSLEHQGYEFEAADASFELLVRKALGQYQPFFELGEYHVSIRKNDDQALGQRRESLHRGRGRRPRECARRRAAHRAGPFLSTAPADETHRLQGAHHRLAQRHRREDARVHREQRRRFHLGHRGRFVRYHRGVVDRAARQRRLHARPR
jgi:2-isopropylmalate synthase